MTNDELTAIRERCEHVPPRTLKVMIHGNDAGVSVVKYSGHRSKILCTVNDEDDAILFAHARADIAALLAEVERLRAALGAVEWIDDIENDDLWCPWCCGIQPDGHADSCQRQLALGVQR